MKISLRTLGFVSLVGIASVGAAHADSPTPRIAASPIAGSELDRQIDRIQRSIHRIDQRLDKLRKQRDVVRRRSIVRARTYYRLMHAGLLPLGGGFDSLIAHTVQVERLRRAIDKDIAQNQRLAVLETKLLAQRKRLQQQQTPLLVQKRAMAEARQALLEAQDRQAAFQRAFSNSDGDYTAVYGTAGPGPWSASTEDEPDQGFAGWFGRLSMPIAGRVEARTVHMPDADGPGLALKGRPGAVVRAVYDGRVAFADSYGAYGKVIIIDHGQRYFTLSGQLDSVDVQVGEQVHRGTPIGRVHTAGKHSGELYFEVRHAGDTLDPKPWFGL